MSKQQVRAHLLDALLSGIVLPPQPPLNVVLYKEEMFHHNAALRGILEGATCIEATNVARFFDQNYMIDDESGEAFWKDLKCLVPPHTKFFIEWDQPRIPTAKRMAMLFVACSPDQAEAVARGVIGVGAKSTPAKIAEFRKNPRCRWIYLTMDFLEFPHKPDDGHVSGLRGPYHIGTISVAEDGSLLEFWMSHGSVIEQKESLQVAAASLVSWTTLAMMNCANIETLEHRMPEAFQKARTRNGKRPLVSTP